MDSGAEGSEIVANAIARTTLKTVTVSRDGLPIIMLFYVTSLYRFSHAHPSPPSSGSGWLVRGPELSLPLSRGRFSQGRVQGHGTNAESLRPAWHVCDPTLGL